MFISRALSKYSPSRLSQIPRYNFFFSQKEPELIFNQEINEDLVSDRKFLPFLKGLDSFPIEIGKEFHKEKKPVNIFSRSAYLSLMASEEFTEWANIFKLYHRALATENLGILEGKIEKNLYDRLDKFFRDIKNTKLSLQLPEVQDPVYKVNIVQHRTFQGVFIDRALNLHLQHYFHKETKDKETYELQSGQKTTKAQNAIKADWDDLLDKDLNKEYLEKDRSGYTINQFILEIETNVKMFIGKDEKGEIKPVYGNVGEGFESHYLIIENKRDYFKKFPYNIVDVDFVLKRNPHVQGKHMF